MSLCVSFRVLKFRVFFGRQRTHNGLVSVFDVTVIRLPRDGGETRTAGGGGREGHHHHQDDDDDDRFDDDFDKTTTENNDE